MIRHDLLVAVASVYGTGCCLGKVARVFNHAGLRDDRDGAYDELSVIHLLMEAQAEHIPPRCWAERNTKETRRT